MNQLEPLSAMNAPYFLSATAMACAGPTVLRPVQTKDQSAGQYTRLAWWLSGLALVTALVYLMATANTGPTDPTESAQPMGHETA
jgi:hypothetical protein